MFRNRPWRKRDETLDRIQELGKDVTLQIPRGRAGMLVKVERGLVLVTREGDRQDHLIAGGSEVLIPTGGVTVAWALAPSRLRVREPGPAEIFQLESGRHEPASGRPPR
jgi:hypothetical protein